MKPEDQILYVSEDCEWALRYDFIVDSLDLYCNGTLIYWNFIPAPNDDPDDLKRIKVPKDMVEKYYFWKSMMQ